MWIVPWNPFLMKKLLKSEVCGSHEQCTGPTGMHCSHEKVNNHDPKKKNENAGCGKSKTHFPNAH